MSRVQPKQLGQVVESMAGRDAGAIYLVVGFQGCRLLLADGRGKKVGKPKMKNIRHVKSHGKAASLDAFTEGKVTDEFVRRALNAAGFYGRRTEEEGSSHVQTRRN
jgi:ribosomal protein L14E/L6E/L27E